MKEYERVLKKESKMRGLMKQFGPCPLKKKRKINVFQAFTRSIIYQQLHGKAAFAIYSRLLDHLKIDEKELNPEMLVRKKIPTLKKLGISENKARSILELSRRMVDGDIPEMASLRKLSNEEIIRVMTEVKGIGPWTVEMFLIFHMGREDVSASGDYGLRKGLMVLNRLKELPKPKEFQELMEPYRPYRSYASWYLWRLADIS